MKKIDNNSYIGILGYKTMLDKLGLKYGSDEANKILVGEHTKKTYKVGDVVTIKVINASKELRQVDFILEYIELTV